MKKLILTLICLQFAGLFFLQAQNENKSTNALYYLIENKLKTEPFNKVAPLFINKSFTSDKTALLNKALTKYTCASLDFRNLRTLYAQNLRSIELSLPTPDGNITVLLTQQDNLTEDFTVINSKTNLPEPYQSGLYYRGIIKGDANSIAALSIFQDEVIAMVSNDAGNYVIGKMGGAEYSKDAYIIYNDADLKKSNPFECSTDDGNPLARIGPSTDAPADVMPGYVSTCKVVRVYIEADSVLYNNKGTVLNTTNYVTGFFNIVATLYQRDSLFTEISQIKVWTTKDPYRITSSSNALNDFGMRVRDTFNGDIAHLVSLAGGYAGLGGVAWLDVLCDAYYASPPTYFSRTAYSGIDATYNSTLPIPVYSWTVEVFTHEMGHNLGSHHTHWCGWLLRPGKYGAIDSCYTRELYLGGCDTSGPIPNSTVKGTIMSYCHLTSSGIKLANGFGLLPGRVVRSTVAAATCLGNSCMCTDWVSLGANRSICDSIKFDGTATFDSIRWSNGTTSRYLTAKITGSYWLKMFKGNCSFTDTVVLTVNTTSRRTLNQAICNGTSYLFNGVNRNSAGTYLDTLLNVRGCDSIITLNLTIKPTSTRTINQTICSGSSYLFNGINRTASGAYKDTFLNYVSCDSVVTLNLTVLPTASSTINATVCTGTSYFFNGANRTIAGAYRDTFASYNGCDSVITLNLGFTSSVSGSMNRSICNGQSYLFNGINRSAAGAYLDTIPSSGGCDSILTLNLNIKPTSAKTIDQTICNGSSYFFNGANRTSAGTYLDTLINYAGCDSLLTLNLTVHTVNTAVTQSGDMLTANATGGVTYQWIDCDNSNAAIAGETNGSYTATSNGNYAVVINDGICVDTSICIPIVDAGVTTIDAANLIAIYPNPANQFFTLKSTNTAIKFIEVINNIGDIVIRKEVTSATQDFDISKLAAALYVVKVKDKNETVLYQQKLNVIK